MKLHYCLIGLLFGCTGDKETGIDETGMAEAFAPTDGSWSFGETVYSSDACNMEDNATTSPAVIDALVFTLTNVSATEVTVENNAGLSLNCTLADMVLTCTNSSENELESYTDLDGNVVTDSDGNPIDPDATNSLDFESVATFTDANTATYTATLTGECTGPDCDTILRGLGITDNPCTSTYGGTFTLQ